MSTINWIQAVERRVGANHPTLADVVNRPLRQYITAMGGDPDGLSPTPTVTVNDGTNAAMAAAIETANALSAAQSYCKINLFMPQRTYALTNLPKITAPITIIVEGGFIYFDPTVDAACFEWNSTTTTGITTGAGIVGNPHFASSNLGGLAKTAIKIVDCVDFTCRHISINDNMWKGGTGPLNAAGVGAGSIGIWVQGRENVRIMDSSFYADTPVFLDKNPNALAGPAADYFTIRDSVLCVNAGRVNPIVDTISGFSFQNLMLDHVGAVRGGFFRTAGTPPVISMNLRISNVRSEQAGVATLWCIDLSSTFPAYNVKIEEVTMDTVANGIRMRNVVNSIIDNIMYDNSANVFLDVDATCYSISGREWGRGAGGATMVGIDLVPNLAVLNERLGVATTYYHRLKGNNLYTSAGGGLTTALSKNAVSANRGDTSQTIVVNVDAPIQRWATTLTANRTVTLSTTGAANGDKFRIVRTGLGAFTLAVGALKTIPSATAAFVDVMFDGAAWVLTGYGTL